MPVIRGEIITKLCQGTTQQMYGRVHELQDQVQCDASTVENFLHEGVEEQDGGEAGNPTQG